MTDLVIKIALLCRHCKLDRLVVGYFSHSSKKSVYPAYDFVTEIHRLRFNKNLTRREATERELGELAYNVSLVLGLLP